jgi:transcriptional regulator with PAS, ATPase and Fis domain
MIDRELFRKDLYFRLGVINVQIPSLNERREDIMPLARHFLQELNRKFNKNFRGISPEAENGLMNYHWTGNVRELKNMVERGALTGKGAELTLQDLGLEAISMGQAREPALEKSPFPPIPQEGIDLTAVEKALEKFYIEEAFKMAKGNESKAAQLLNINHHTYRYRRRKLHEAK